MTEEATYRVTATLRTTIDFSPIERDRPLSHQDAIDNAMGTVPDSVWTTLEDEGWSVEFEAERL